jgi:hypothetical protein
MTIKHSYVCNGCGKDVADPGAATEYSGIHCNQTMMAAGEANWHACSAECAAKHLRDVADAVIERSKDLAHGRAQAQTAADQFAAEQAAVRAKLEAEAQEREAKAVPRNPGSAASSPQRG